VRAHVVPHPVSGLPQLLFDQLEGDLHA